MSFMGPMQAGLGAGGGGAGAGGMAAFAPWMLAGGLGLDAVGGFLNGQSQNRAARKGRDWENERTTEGYQRFINQLNGGGDPHALNTPGGSLPAPTSTSILGRLNGLAGWAQGQGESIAGKYGADTSRLMGLAGGAENLASRWGQGRAAVINSDMDKALREANRGSAASLAAGGFNSPTTLANSLAGNQANIGRERQRALEDSSEAQIDRQLGARSQTLQVGGARASGETGLLTSLLGNNTALRQAPINMQYAAATSPIANPWLNQNPSSFYPGASGAGNAAGSLGSGLAAVGSYDLGGQNQAALLQRLLGQMRAA